MAARVWLGVLVVARCSRDAAMPREPAGVGSAGGGAAAEPTDVLFIGNSYVYFHNLPVVFDALATAAGREVDTRMIAPGGVTLQAHWDTAETRRALTETSWEFVVLQEQSTLGVNHVVAGVPRVTTDGVFRAAARLWTDEIVRAGARPVFFETWARRDAPDDQLVLDRAYSAAALEGNALLAPIGPAWARANDRARLFEDDGSHPSQEGTYLAALVLYATMFDRDPSGLPSTIRGQPVDLDTELPVPGAEAVLVDVLPDRARELQALAWAVVGGR